MLGNRQKLQHLGMQQVGGMEPGFVGIKPAAMGLVPQTVWFLRSPACFAPDRKDPRAFLVDLADEILRDKGLEGRCRALT
jgi:hypothetical protein